MTTAPDDGKQNLISGLRQLPMRHRWLSWAVLGASLAFGAGGTYLVYHQAQDDAHSTIRIVALGMAHGLESRIRANTDVLYALRALFSKSDKVTRDDFHEFAQKISLSERNPELTNISYSLPVSRDQKAAFERAVRAETSPLLTGLPEFSIKPAGDRLEYEVLTFIEPMVKGDLAWGLDVIADPLRRAATERARDSGQVTSTTAITLVQDTKLKVPTLLLRLAVYRGKGVPQTIEDRRRLYVGTVRSAVRIGEMVEAVLSETIFSGARLRILNRSDPAGPFRQLLFDSQALDGAVPSPDYPAYAVTQQLTVGDDEWQVEITPVVDPLDTVARLEVAGILVASLVISVLLFWLVSTVATSEARRAELAKTNEALEVENVERKRTEKALHRSETKFRTLYDSSGDAVMLLDQKGFFDCNPATLAMFGCVTREEFYSKHPVDLSPPAQPDGTDSLTLASQRIATAMAKGSSHFEWMHKRADTGETFPADVLLKAITLDGKPVFQAVVRDITERKRADSELLRFATELEQRIVDVASANDALQRETEELHRLNEERAALGNLNELLLACASADEAFDIFGRAATALFESLTGALHIFAASRNQLTPAATWGEWPDAVMPFSPESCWGLRRGNYYLGNGTSMPPCEHAGSVPAGATLCVPLMAHGEVLGVLHLRGADPSTLRSKLQLVTIANDGLALTLANIRLRQSLKEQAIRDPLTGLFNRRYLTETLERELVRAQRSGMPVAIVMIDVDHFKRFNDSFGHDAGDAVLSELGSFLKRAVRVDDIACRYGGEEFCLVLPQMDYYGAQQRAEAIRAGAAALEVKSDGRVLGPVTLSLGVALFPEDGGDMESLVRAADAALYEGKKAGRNRVVMTSAAPLSEQARTLNQTEQSP